MWGSPQVQTKCNIHGSPIDFIRTSSASQRTTLFKQSYVFCMASRPWLGSSSSGSSVRWWVMDGRSHQRIFAVRDQGRQVKNDIQTRGRTQNPATAGASHHPITSCYRSPFRLQLSVARGESSSARPSIEGPHSRPGRYCITILV